MNILYEKIEQIIKEKWTIVEIIFQNFIKDL